MTHKLPDRRLALMRGNEGRRVGAKLGDGEGLARTRPPVAVRLWASAAGQPKGQQG